MPTRLGICGDSAGATLAAATCQSAIQAGGPQLILQLLLCPILDYSRVTASKRELSSGYLVDQATLDHDLMYYLPSGTDAFQSAGIAAAGRGPLRHAADTHSYRGIRSVAR